MSFDSLIRQELQYNDLQLRIERDQRRQRAPWYWVVYTDPLDDRDTPQRALSRSMGYYGTPQLAYNDAIDSLRQLRHCKAVRAEQSAYAIRQLARS